MINLTLSLPVNNIIVGGYNPFVMINLTLSLQVKKFGINPLTATKQIDGPFSSTVKSMIINLFPSF